MAKRLKILIGVLAVFLVMAAPALAQDETTGSEPAQTPSPESPPGGEPASGDLVGRGHGHVLF